jgi:DNA polymerase III subunit epsilon
MRMSSVGPIAVIDVETTGLFPSRNDRVVEIAVVVTRADGTIEREFTSLINPARDIGPMHIHGLTSEDIIGAPRFGEIAASIVGTMQGCIAIAAHNLPFDRQFLDSEFERIGYQLPACFGMCTLSIFHHNLESCCRQLDIPVSEFHQALADARAAAKLLARHLRDDSRSHKELSRLIPIAWPSLPAATKSPVNRTEVRQRQKSAPSYIQRLVGITRASPLGAQEEAQGVAYLDLLDRLLEDRCVENAEADALYETAMKWGLDGQHIGQLHNRYLTSLADAAIADGVITDSELRDLSLVARLLGLPELSMDELLARTAARFPIKREEIAPSQAAAPATGPVRSDLRGQSVCFTGELLSYFHGERLSRERAEEFAANAGLTVQNGVTKSLNILVVADPQTQSGKAKKARQYGVRVMHEPVFWRTIGVDVE